MAKNAFDEILYGGAEIARCLGINKRAVYHLCARGRLPTWKEGKVLFARRASIKVWAAEREAAAKAAGRFTNAGGRRRKAAV